MDMTKRIEIAARLLANMMPELLSATDEARAKMGRLALDWVDALEEVAMGDVTVKPVAAPKYSWNRAPEWAMWAATDKNGDVYYFSIRPVVNEELSQWNNDEGSVCARIRKGARLIHDWRGTLEPRPRA